MWSVSWPLFHQHALILCDKLKEAGVKPDTILAITRGGLVPAAIVARQLGVGRVETVGVKTYSKREREVPLLIKYPVRLDGRVLVVDDLVDTGATASFVRLMLPPNSVIAAVYSKPAGRRFADFVGVERERNDEWIIFPWEA